jgi:hypothetical protein
MEKLFKNNFAFGPSLNSKSRIVTECSSGGYN